MPVLLHPELTRRSWTSCLVSTLDRTPDATGLAGVMYGARDANAQLSACFVFSCLFRVVNI